MIHNSSVEYLPNKATSLPSNRLNSIIVFKPPSLEPSLMNHKQERERTCAFRLVQKETQLILEMLLFTANALHYGLQKLRLTLVLI